MSSSRRRREWCRLVLSVFLSTFTFLFFSQMTTYGELKAAEIDDNGQVDDGGQITCRDDDGDANTDNDDADDANSPQDDDDCAGGGGSGGSGGGDTIPCPDPAEDHGHLFLSRDIFTDVDDLEQIIAVPFVFDAGESFSHVKYYPAAIVVPACLVNFMDTACCKDEQFDRARLLDGDFRTTQIGGTGQVNIKYKSHEHPFDYVPLPDELPSWAGIDIGCEQKFFWQQNHLIRLEGVQAGQVNYQMEFDPYKLDHCDWDGDAESQSYFSADIYRFNSYAADDDVDLKRAVELVYCDVDEDGENDNLKPIEIVVEVDAPYESAPLGDFTVRIRHTVHHEESLIRIETADGDVLRDGMTIQAQDSQSFFVWVDRDPEGIIYSTAHMFELEYNLPYNLAENIWIEWDDTYASPEYHAAKAFSFVVNNIEVMASPAAASPLTADQGSPGWAEVGHSMMFIHREAWNEESRFMVDGTEVEWNLKSGAGRLTETLSSTESSMVKTVSQLVTTTGESQEVEAKITKMVFEQPDGFGGWVDVITPTDIEVPFPQFTVEPGQGDHMILSYLGAEGPSPSLPGSGRDTVGIEIEVFDQYDNVVADGTPVDLILDYGRFLHYNEDSDPDWPANTMLETVDGKVSTLLQSNLLWEDSLFDISLQSGVAGSEQVPVNDVICTLSADKSQLDAGQGEQTLVTATFVDSQGQRVADDTPVYPYCTHGSILSAVDNSWLDYTEPLLTKDGQVQFICDSQGAAIRSGNDIAIGASLKRSYGILRMPIVHTGGDLHMRVVNESNKNRMTLSMSESVYSEEPFCLDDDGDLCDVYKNHVATKLEVVGNPNDLVTVSHLWPSEVMCHLFSVILGGATLPDECQNHDAQVFGGALDSDEFVSAPSSLCLEKTDKIVIPDHNDLSLGDGTFLIWVLLKGEGKALGQPKTLIEKSGEYLLEVTNKGQIEFTVYTDQGSNMLTSQMTLSPEMWLPIQFGVRDGQQYLRVGQSQNHDSITGNLLNSDTDLVVGDGFAGCIDDFMITRGVEYFGDSHVLSISGLDGQSQLVLDSNGVGLIEIQSLGHWQPRSEIECKLFTLKATRDPGFERGDDDEVVDYIFQDFIATYRLSRAAHQASIGAGIYGLGMLRDWAIEDVAYHDGQQWQMAQQFRRSPVNIFRQKEQEAAMFALEFTGAGPFVEVVNFGLAAMGPDKISVFAWAGVSLSAFSLMLVAIPPLKALATPFLAALRKVLAKLEKVPTKFSRNFAQMIGDWGHEGADIVEGIQRGLMDTAQLAAFMKEKADFARVLGKKADDLDDDQFHRLVEAIAGNAELTKKHVATASKIGGNFYEFFLDALIKVQNNPAFRINGYTPEQVANQVSFLVNSFGGDILRRHFTQLDDVTDEIVEGFAWMIAKSDVKGILELKNFFIDQGKDGTQFILKEGRLHKLCHGMTRLARDSSTDQVRGFDNMLKIFNHPVMIEFDRRHLLDRFDLMGRYANSVDDSLDIYHIDLVREIGVDIPVFRAEDVDYIPLDSLDTFKESLFNRARGESFDEYDKSLVFIERVREDNLTHTPLKFIVANQEHRDEYLKLIDESVELPPHIKEEFSEMFVLADPS